MSDATAGASTAFATNEAPASGERAESTLSPEAEAAKAQLSFQAGSSLDLLKDMQAELSTHNDQLLTRVRTSLAMARKAKPNLRLAQDDDGGMKTVDMSALLSIIKEAELKRDVQKAVKESEKMVKDISNLLVYFTFFARRLVKLTLARARAMQIVVRGVPVKAF